MGHYLSEIEGLPFTIDLSLGLEGRIKEEISSRFLKEDDKILELRYSSITMDSERKWFKLHYRDKKGINYEVSLSSLEIREVFGEDSFLKYNLELEELRKKVLEKR